MNKKYIILDTETTGLEVHQGHRVIEIGAVLLNDRKKSDENFHSYLNPERVIDEEASKVHGITNADLDDKPLFSEIVEEFLEFIEGSTLVIHNAPFDVGFLNNEIKFTGKNQWHLRLFKPKNTFCENRLYDQHFISKDILDRIDGHIYDNGKESLKEYVLKIKRWAKLEAKEQFLNKNKEILKGRFSSDPREKYRLFKNIYYRLPKYIRPICYFIYRYFFMLGFLDGKAGFLFCYYQGFLFRYLVDVEISRIKFKKNEKQN